MSEENIKNKALEALRVAINQLILIHRNKRQTYYYTDEVLVSMLDDLIMNIDELLNAEG